MTRAVHLRTEDGWGNYPNKTACGQLGFNVPDTDAVTCPACRLTGIYTIHAQRHREVVEALAYPKEDHPCLNPSRR
jgi:hypothetical protein